MTDIMGYQYRRGGRAAFEGEACSRRSVHEGQKARKKVDALGGWFIGYYLLVGH